MRFRKSVTLCKGVRLNFSKSGVSLSLGGKGATINVSKRGVYSTIGNGRKKIFGPEPKNSAGKSAVPKKPEKEEQLSESVALKEKYDEINRQYTDIFRQSVQVKPKHYYVQLVEEKEQKGDEQAQQLKRLLANDSDEIDARIEAWTSTLVFPFEYDIEYEVVGTDLWVDLDLPEIEDMPDKVAKELKSGEVKVEQKSKKAQKEDYYRCVLGLALYLASGLFECAIGIERIILSAYTQRKNSKGVTTDDYIYSVKFPREKMEEIDTEQAADRAFFKFETICYVKADLTFKTIKPFELDGGKNSEADVVSDADIVKLSEADQNRIHVWVEDGLASGEMNRYSFIAAVDGKKD